MMNKEIALAYLNRGLSVIPLWSPKMLKHSPPKYFKEHLDKKLQENSKMETPLAQAGIIEKEVVNQCKISLIPWKEFQNRHPTKEEIIQWFDENPDANIGIITGKRLR